jgi:hypothetical protein
LLGAHTPCQVHPAVRGIRVTALIPEPATRLCTIFELVNIRAYEVNISLPFQDINLPLTINLTLHIHLIRPTFGYGHFLTNLRLQLMINFLGHGLILFQLLKIVLD